MVKDYDLILDSYRRMFGMVDAFHFNSQNTAGVYGRYLDIPAASKVIPITHSGIKDNRKKRGYDDHLLRLGFIGSEAPYKGLPMLKDVLSQLNKAGYSDKIKLYVYGGRTGEDEILTNLIYKGRFTSAMMEQVFDDMDLLVVPSIWHETFSLVTMEALSFGTCVLVSDKVGAKDIVYEYAPHFIFKNEIELIKILTRILVNRQELITYNEALFLAPWKWSMKDHANDIIRYIYE